MNYYPPTSRGRPVAVKNRLAALMLHIPYYSCWGLSRLARDAGVSRYAVSALLQGTGMPSYAVIHQIGQAMSRRMGKPLDLAEIAVAEPYDYPTPYPCLLFDCHCLPDWAYRPDGSRKPEWESVKPGEWRYDKPEALIN